MVGMADWVATAIVGFVLGALAISALWLVADRMIAAVSWMTRFER